MTDLIERLRNFEGSDALGNGDFSLLHEAAAALEAAREDAERYRWLRKGANRGANDDIAVVRGLGAMDYGMSAVVSTYSEEIDGDDLDAAIDQARGKGVQDEA